MKLIKEAKKDNEKRLKKLIEYENYIINHWNKIQNMFKSECRSSMESHISHCIASHFSSRPKAYSKTNIEKLLKLQEAKLNGIGRNDLWSCGSGKKFKHCHATKGIDEMIFITNCDVTELV